MDSIIGWFYLSTNNPVVPLYARLGHRYQSQELEALEHIQHLLSLLPTRFPFKFEQSMALGAYGKNYEQSDANIPARNLLLAVEAANRGATEIAIVCQADERTLPDRNEMFFKRSSDLLSQLYEKHVRVSPVFQEWDKTDMVNWFLDTHDLDLSYQDRVNVLLATTACYQPVEIDKKHQQCGNCPACFRRAVALINNGLTETYAQNVFESDVAREYLDKLGRYSVLRQKRTVMALYKSGSSLYKQALKLTQDQRSLESR
jgi:7-cyano-7-deazaguanine synthase in queuosine biosynthesis